MDRNDLSGVFSHGQWGRPVGRPGALDGSRRRLDLSAPGDGARRARGAQYPGDLCDGGRVAAGPGVALRARTGGQARDARHPLHDVHLAGLSRDVRPAGAERPGVHCGRAPGVGARRLVARGRGHDALHARPRIVLPDGTGSLRTGTPVPPARGERGDAGAHPAASGARVSGAAPGRPATVRLERHLCRGSRDRGVVRVAALHARRVYACPQRVHGGRRRGRSRPRRLLRPVLCGQLGTARAPSSRCAGARSRQRHRAARLGAAHLGARRWHPRVERRRVHRFSLSGRPGVLRREARPVRDRRPVAARRQLSRAHEHRDRHPRADPLGVGPRVPGTRSRTIAHLPAGVHPAGRDPVQPAARPGAADRRPRVLALPLRSPCRARARERAARLVARSRRGLPPRRRHDHAHAAARALRLLAAHRRALRRRRQPRSRVAVVARRARPRRASPPRTPRHQRPPLRRAPSHRARRAHLPAHARAARRGSRCCRSAPAICWDS